MDQEAMHPGMALAFGLGTILVLGVVALVLFRGFEKLARSSLQRCYQKLPESQGDQLVTIRFTTHHGLIAWFTSIPHEVTLPPEAAQVLLNRLLRFNLTWGLLTWGALFLPIFSVVSYFSQRRVISLGSTAAAPGSPQETAGDESEADRGHCQQPEDGLRATADATESSAGTAFRRLIGALAAFLSVVFGVASVVSLTLGEFESGIGAILLSLLLGSTARDWLRRGDRTGG
jgi:hypothetical protein